MRRSPPIRLRAGLLVSAIAHAGAVALMWFAVQNAEELPEMRVYAVDIVSPPPQLEGEPNPGGGGAPAVEEAPEPEPEPEVEETEEPPAPPEPTPPKPEAPPQREPSPPAQATRPEPAPSRSEPAKEEPEEEPEEEEEEPPAPQPGGGTGEGRGASRGDDPEPESVGGEDIDVRLRGVQCPSPAYCANIVRQLYRYFRPPEGATSDAVEIFFWINRDGSTEDMRVVRSSGSYSFQIAALEAVEQAGRNRAFGPLPSSFQRDRLPVSFYFRPAR